MIFTKSARYKSGVIWEKRYYLQQNKTFGVIWEKIEKKKKVINLRFCSA